MPQHISHILALYGEDNIRNIHRVKAKDGRVLYWVYFKDWTKPSKMYNPNKY